MPIFVYEQKKKGLPRDFRHTALLYYRDAERLWYYASDSQTN